MKLTADIIVINFISVGRVYISGKPVQVFFGHQQHESITLRYPTGHLLGSLIADVPIFNFSMQLEVRHAIVEDLGKTFRVIIEYLM